MGPCLDWWVCIVYIASRYTTIELMQGGKMIARQGVIVRGRRENANEKKVGLVAGASGSWMH